MTPRPEHPMTRTCPDHGWEACMTRDGRCWVCALVEASARKEAERLAAAEAAKPKPMCRERPGQVATHCGPCRSERIARGRDEEAS